MRAKGDGRGEGLRSRAEVGGCCRSWSSINQGWIRANINLNLTAYQRWNLNTTLLLPSRSLQTQLEFDLFRPLCLTLTSLLHFLLWHLFGRRFIDGQPFLHFDFTVLLFLLGFRWSGMWLFAVESHILLRLFFTDWIK